MSKKKKAPSKSQPSSVTTDHIGGLRDIAEILSTSYFLMLSRAGVTPDDDIMDMDVLTQDLMEMDPSLVTTLLHNDFGKGFLMGMLHQSYTYQKLAEEHEREEGD